MKNIIAFILMMTLGYLATKYGPWYLIGFAGLVGGLIVKNQWHALLVGFLAGFTLWMFQIWLMTNASESDLPARMAKLFSLPGETSLVLLSAIVGGLITAFGAAAGGSINKIFRQ